MLIPTVSFAAGSVTATLTKVDVPFMGSRGVKKLVISWIADAAAATVPDTSLTAAVSGGIDSIKGWSCVLAVTDPGATAPTDDYDITIEDEYGVDIFGTALNNRDTANSEQALPLIATSTYGPRLITGNLTFKLANNSVNSALGQCVLYFVLEQ